MDGTDFLHAENDGIIFGCSLSLDFKYWVSTVVVLHCSYLLRCLLNFGVPQSLSHGQYCSDFPIASKICFISGIN